MAFVHAGEGDAAHSASRSDVLAPSVALFADPARSAQLAATCREMGLAIASARPFASLAEGSGGPLGDIVLADLRVSGAMELAALCRLDERAARSGARVIVLAAAEDIDAVFGCLCRCAPQILVDPRPGDLATALIRATPGQARMRLRELDDTERLGLLRLTEEVGRLAARLERLALPLAGDGPDSQTARLASPGIGYRAETGAERLRQPRPALPDPRLIHTIIRQRRLRERYFESELFADPAWDILLDLTAARAEHRRVSVTSLCIAAAVPTTTALRWIQQMTDMGLLVRQSDPDDKRRAFIGLADPVADAMARYFAELGKQAARAI